MFDHGFSNYMRHAYPKVCVLLLTRLDYKGLMRSLEGLACAMVVHSEVCPRLFTAAVPRAEELPTGCGGVPGRKFESRTAHRKPFNGTADFSRMCMA